MYANICISHREDPVYFILSALLLYDEFFFEELNPLILIFFFEIFVYGSNYYVDSPKIYTFQKSPNMEKKFFDWIFFKNLPGNFLFFEVF